MHGKWIQSEGSSSVKILRTAADIIFIVQHFTIYLYLCCSLSLILSPHLPVSLPLCVSVSRTHGCTFRNNDFNHLLWLEGHQTLHGRQCQMTSFRFACDRSINWSVNWCGGQRLKPRWLLMSCCQDGLRWSHYGFTCQPPWTFNRCRSGGLRWWVGFDPTSSAARCRGPRSPRQLERRDFFFLLSSSSPSSTSQRSAAAFISGMKLAVEVVARDKRQEPSSKNQRKQSPLFSCVQFFLLILGIHVQLKSLEVSYQLNH